MGYVEENLKSDEYVIAGIKHSARAIIPEIIVAVICVVLFVVAIIELNPVINAIVKWIADIFGEDEDFFAVLFKIFNPIIKIVVYVFGGFIVVVAILNLISTYVEIKSSQLVVTNKRLLGKRGLISKDTVDIMLAKVDSVKSSNGFFGGIFNYGEISIASAGSLSMTPEEKAALTFDYISNVTEFKQAVIEAIDKAKAEESEVQAQALSRAINSNGGN